jgi:hypothetical protein
MKLSIKIEYGNGETETYIAQATRVGKMGAENWKHNQHKPRKKLGSERFIVFGISRHEAQSTRR